MRQSTTQGLHVSVDTGCYQHHAAVGLSNGKYLGSFEFPHTKLGFAEFFSKIDRYKKHSNGKVCVAMEGYNGHARPLDRMVIDCSTSTTSSWLDSKRSFLGQLKPIR